MDSSWTISSNKKAGTGDNWNPMDHILNTENYMNNHHEYHDEVSIPMAYGPEHAHNALSHSEMTIF